MSFLIIIRGPLGVGKSTIAQKIAQDLKGKYFSIDNILSQNKLDQVNENEGCIPEVNFLEANKIILLEVEKAINNKVPVIIDGNFYHQNQIEDLIKNFPKNFVFTLTAPLKVCIQRDSQRPNTYGIGAATAVYNLVSKFNYGQTINTKDLSVEETVNFIKSKIKKSSKIVPLSELTSPRGKK
jgi:shikimate kinase